MKNSINDVLRTEPYKESLQRLPMAGKHIIGYQDEDCIVVYQAYCPSIAAFAVQHQRLGGNDFSYERMSWIKPGFLWMMFRSGWAGKEDQERILALWLDRKDFRNIVKEAVPTTYKRDLYASEREWKTALKTKDVRIQWDPDHDPFGRKGERRAIQLGLSGRTLELFGQSMIKRIEDITPFVQEQKAVLDRHGVEQLQVPFETIMPVEESELLLKAGIKTR